MFQNVAVDGTSSCIPGEEIGEEDEERYDDYEGYNIDNSPMSTSTRKRGCSASVTVTSPTKKSKSPIVKIMKGMLDNFKKDTAATQQAIQGDNMPQSMKKALQLAAESGAAKDGIEYFMAT